MTKLYRPLIILVLIVSAVLTASPPPPAYAASIAVDGTTCTLTDAIRSANANADTGGCVGASSAYGADVIILNANVTLTAAETTYSTNVLGAYAGLPNITSNITIQAGLGSTIQRTYTTCNGPDPDFRIFNVWVGGTLALEGITVSNGCSHASGGGIFVMGGGALSLVNTAITNNVVVDTTGNGAVGGGIRNSGTITAITNATIANNVAQGADSADNPGTVARGGGIRNFGTITAITNSTIANNSALGGDSFLSAGGEATGGGIANSGTITAITNSTIANNAVHGGNSTNGTGGVARGGGIHNSGAGSSVTVNNSTVAGNSAFGGIGAASGASTGGGLENAAGTNTAVFSTILADNTVTSGANDCRNQGTLTSNGYNVVEVPGNCTFTAAGDQRDNDPGLGALADNGCAVTLPGGSCVETMAITAASIALDAGSCGLTGITDDERGGIVTRPQDYAAVANAADACDAGAFELPAPLDLRVVKTDSPDPVEAGSGTGNLTYIVTVTNLSTTAAATNVQVSDVFTLPAGVTIDGFAVSQGSVIDTMPTYAWNVGMVGPLESATLTFALTVGASASPGMDVISNTATITVLDQNDLNPDNDTATATTSIIVPAVTEPTLTPPPGSSGGEGGARIDPALSKIGILQPGGLGLPGEQIRWTITAFGPFANGVITDTFPPEVRVDSVTTTVSTASTSGQTVTVNLDGLAADQSATITVLTTIISSPLGPTIDNRAILTGDRLSLTASASVPVVTSLPSTGYEQ